ncbi:LOW QUALITY PROTEIN: apolipoprotein L5 [Equus caballus]|uniref:LOW QUALITY PROTEIN: apolipoprotein L5 n=1 Tax=Equus caballus TaxID=9796 RepID=UPI0038B30CB4
MQLEESCPRNVLASLGNLSQNWKNNHVIWTVPRDEADVLYRLLSEELMRCEQVSVPDGNPSEEEKMFLLCFPLWKYKLEKTIKELNTIADQVDAAHKMLTKTPLVASSSGAVSAAVSLLGLALAPVTVGGSLMLSALGHGLGAAAVMTNILTSVLENRSNSAARDRARRLVSLPATGENEALGGINLSEVRAVDLPIKQSAGVINIRELQAYRTAKAKANSGFGMATVKNFAATGCVPFWRARGVKRAVEGPALAMTRGARLMAVAGAGFFLMQEVKSLLQNWRHLEAGARVEMAEQLRPWAKELEQWLGQLTRRYELMILRRGSEEPSLNQKTVKLYPRNLGLPDAKHKSSAKKTRGRKIFARHEAPSNDDRRETCSDW